MAAELFDWLLRSAGALAVAACLVMALRPLWRRWLGAGAVLWLYLLLPAALLATSLPGPTIVVDEPVAHGPAPGPALMATAAPVLRPSPPANLATGLAVASVASHTPASTPPVSRDPQVGALTAALLAWAAGALVLAGWLLVQQRRFRRRLGALQESDAGLWRASADDIGPVVIGLLRPRIVVPADFEQRYDPQQRELVLAHERAHLRRGDLPMNALACVLRCVFWFNPLVHLAAAKLRLDQELACDAAVLARHPRAGRAYATALLNTQLADLGLPVGCAWQSSHPLTWRISMLKKPLPGTARLMLGAGLAVLASSAAATAIWQQQPATVVSLPAVSLAAATAPLPPLAVEGRMPAPAPSAAPSVAFAAVAAAPVATPAPASPVAPAAPVAAPGPVRATPAIAPVARPGKGSTTPAPRVSAVNDAASSPAGVARAERAPLPPPLHAERIYAYSQNPPLPPPPMPSDESGQLEVTEPKVVLVAGANPDAEAAGYQPPRIRLAKPARLPFLASARPETLVAYGMVMKVEVDTTGKPVDVKVHDSKLTDVYQRNALAAVKRWRFEPASLAGQPQEATVLVPVWFAGSSVRNFESEAMRHPRPQYRMPVQAVAGQ
ncbi:TonB family protein [Arenimonas aestuarii]